MKRIIQRLLDLGSPIKWDHQGFNKFDYRVAYELVLTSFWSEKEEHRAAQILYKYRNTQLEKEEIKLVESYLKNFSKITLQLSLNQISLIFYYDKKIIEKVKEISSRRFDPIKKVWTISLSSFEETLKKLEGLAIEVDPKIYQALDELAQEKKELEINPLQEQSPLRLISAKELPRSGYICLDKEENGILVKTEWEDGCYDKIVRLGRYSNGHVKIKDRDYIIQALDLIVSQYPGYVCTEKTFEFYLYLKEQQEAQEKRDNEIKTIVEADQTQSSLKIPSCITGQPYPFQLKGIEFMLKAGSGIISDEMGLGKTIQAIVWSECLLSQKTLVVCPASLKWNWKKEIEKWTNKKGSFLGDGFETPYQITNYEALIDRAETIGVDDRGRKEKGSKPSVYMPFVLNQKWDCIILDEAHKMKSQKANQTKAVQRIRSLFKHHCLLTGTPLINRPIELFPLLNYVAPNKWNNFFKFAKEYAGAHQGRWGWDFSGATNQDKLREEIKPYMIRRKKEEVLPNLPEKTVQVIEVGLNGVEREYRRAEEALIAWIAERYGDERAMRASRAEQLTRFNYLKQICSNAKIDMVLELVKNANGNKLVIFSQYKEPLRKLKEELKEKAVLYTGDESTEDRNRAVEAFQSNPDIQVFLGSIKAGGLGITLTAASTTLMMDLPWTPADMEQAEARIHRIGQKNAVLACRLICRDTIEESILTLLGKKKEVISNILGERQEIIEKEDILDSLINQLLGKEE